MKIKKDKIFLGTAQFLSNYGISNTNKNLSKKYFLKILDFAANKSIINYDTAPDYKSEKVIGEFIKSNKLKNVKLTTKIPKIKTNNYKLFVENSISRSLQNVNCNIFTLFFHNVGDIKIFLRDPEFFLSLKKKFSIRNLGFSVYELKDLEAINNLKIRVSLQFPFNILNESFNKIIEKKNFFEPLFARSIFLQGLLTKKPKKNINKHTQTSVQSYFKFLKNHNISPLELCLSHAAKRQKIDYFIFGVENYRQIENIISTNLININEDRIKKIKSFFSNSEIDPRNW